MIVEDTRRTQRPYRYGMILLCFGALANWLGLAENYAEPIRYLGVACIIAGALLICTAMCCWLHTPNRRSTTTNNSETNDGIHVINMPDESRRQKPPDYDTVAIAPPSYDDAIKLNPSILLHPPPPSAFTIDHNTNNISTSSLARATTATSANEVIAGHENQLSQPEVSTSSQSSSISTLSSSSLLSPNNIHQQPIATQSDCHHNDR